MFYMICGTFDYLTNVFGPASDWICYSFPSSCDTFAILADTRAQPPLQPNIQYMSIAPRILQTSKTSNGVIPLDGQVIPLIPYGYISGGTGTSQMSFFSVKNTSSSGISFQYASVSGVFSQVINVFATIYPYSDFDDGTPTTFYSYGYYASSTTLIHSEYFICPKSYSSSITCTTGFVAISGYFLLNHYAYAEGLAITLPIFILTNTTHIILATVRSGDLSLGSGLSVMTAAPIVGCTPDRGTMINWNNLANPYPNTVHLYTMCNFVVLANSTAASGAVYEIAVSGSSLSFSRWQALPNLYTAVDLEVIGEYGQILTTNDKKTSPPQTDTPGLYSLYDPYNPVYLGYATLSAAQNPNNTVDTRFFSIAGDMSSGVCSNTNISWYNSNQMYNGLDLMTLTFCGSGNSLYNNATYCDGPGACCTDNCQYLPTNTSCPTTNMTNICSSGYCVTGDVNCVGANATNGTIIQNATICETAFYCDGAGHLVNGTYLSNTTLCNSGNVTYCVEPSYCTGSTSSCPANTNVPNGTFCGTYLGICHTNSTCSGGVCVPGTPLANGTVITPATNCTTAYYCDGAGNLVNGTFLPNGTIIANATGCLQTPSYCDGAGNIVQGILQPSSHQCSAGNVSACLGAVNCTGSSPTCPPNPVLPNNTPCSNTSSCGGNFTDVCTGGTCTPNALCNCSILYPCANYTSVVNSSCVPSGLKPAGTVCNTTSPTTVGACMISGGVCTGSSTLCPTFSFAPDGANCSIQFSAICNETGECSSGNCIFTSTCAPATTLPSFITEVLETVSYGPSSLSVGLTAGLIGGLGAIILVVSFIFFILLFFSQRDDDDNKKD